METLHFVVFALVIISITAQRNPKERTIKINFEDFLPKFLDKSPLGFGTQPRQAQYAPEPKGSMKYMIVSRPNPSKRYAVPHSNGEINRHKIKPLKIVREGNIKHVYIDMADLYDRKKNPNFYDSKQVGSNSHYQFGNLQNYAHNIHESPVKYANAPLQMSFGKDFPNYNADIFKGSQIQHQPNLKLNYDSSAFNQGNFKQNQNSYPGTQSPSEIFNQEFNQQASSFNQEGSKFNQGHVFDQGSSDFKTQGGSDFNSQESSYNSQISSDLHNQGGDSGFSGYNQGSSNLNQDHSGLGTVSGGYRLGKSGFRPITSEYAPQFKAAYSAPQNLADSSQSTAKFVPSTPIDHSQFGGEVKYEIPPEYKNLFSKFSEQHGLGSDNFAQNEFSASQFEPSHVFDQSKAQEFETQNYGQSQEFAPKIAHHFSQSHEFSPKLSNYDLGKNENTKYDPELVNIVHEAMNNGQATTTADGFKVIKSKNDNSVYLVGQPGMSLNSVPNIPSYTFQENSKDQSQGTTNINY